MQIEVRSRSANSTVQTQLRQYRISSLNSGIDTVESLPIQKPLQRSTLSLKHKQNGRRGSAH